MSAPPQSTTQSPESITDTRSPAQDIPQQSRPQEQIPSPTPVEMSSLPPARASQDLPPASRTTSAESQSRLGPQRIDTNTAIDQSLHPSPAPPPLPTEHAPVTRTFSTAIGPSSDLPAVPSKDTEASGPVLLVTLLLTSGARHPFKLDAKYLSKRNVQVPDADPFNLSVYKLKELILREWREEWETKPTSPNYIRLISFGKLLDDNAALRDYKFSFDSPNVLHMTIKPQDFVEDEDAKGGKSTLTGPREDEGRSPGCRCLVM